MIWLLAFFHVTWEKYLIRMSPWKYNFPPYKIHISHPYFLPTSFSSISPSRLRTRYSPNDIKLKSHTFLTYGMWFSRKISIFRILFIRTYLQYFLLLHFLHFEEFRWRFSLRQKKVRFSLHFRLSKNKPSVVCGKDKMKNNFRIANLQSNTLRKSSFASHPWKPY